MKNVILAKTAGFCFGVRRAVDMAYGIAGRDKVYTYGPIIHNETVVEDLEAKGVKVVHSIEEAAALAGGTMIIRSHGVSKEEIDLLKQMGFDIVDATCPFVKKIHHIVGIWHYYYRQCGSSGGAGNQRVVQGTAGDYRI